MQQLAPNPTNDRLKFILKTYGTKKPVVVRDMITVVANTVGLDRWVEVMRDRVKDADPQFADDLDKWGANSLAHIPGINDPSTAFVTAAVDLVSTMPQFKARHRADPIFPWMATHLAKSYDQLVRAQDPKTPLAVSDPSDMLREYRTTLRKMHRGGTMLSQWYEATRPNLGQYDFDTAWDEAQRWEEEEGPVPQGQVVAKLADGWTAQKLTTAEQLNAEGDKMQHCVGSYAREVAASRTTIFSLRDAKGQPHVTIEVKNDRVQQTQGKQNEKPAPKYQKYVDEFYEWLEENDISTNKISPHLQAYVDAMEEHGGIDAEDEYLESYAREWDENTASAADAAEWMKHGLSYSEAELAGSLNAYDVTPEEYVKFPYAVHYKITENGGVPSKLEEMIKIAHMTLKLMELAPQRDPPRPPSEQTEMFAPVSGPDNRIPGQDPKGRVPSWSRWQDPAKDKPHPVYKSILFDDWGWDAGGHGDEENQWLYPAEEWLAAEFTSDPDDDEWYVGPWFIHRFSVPQATRWHEAGIENGDQAAELRKRRVTPQMVEEVERAEGPDSGLSRTASTLHWREANDHVWDMSAAEIIDVIDARGMHRNTGKRASKKRASKRTSRPRR
jgi:hypothetical protein